MRLPAVFAPILRATSAVVLGACVCLPAPAAENPAQPLPATIAASPQLPSLILDPAGSHQLDVEVRDNIKFRFLIPQQHRSDVVVATSGVWQPLESVALSAGYGIAEPVSGVPLRGCDAAGGCISLLDRSGTTIETYSLGASWQMSDTFSLKMDYLSRSAEALEVIASPPWIGSQLGGFGGRTSALDLSNAEALDISLTCDIDAGQWGDLELGLQVSRVVNQGIEFRGQANDAPLTSAAFGLGWQRGAFRGDLTSRYLDVTSQPDQATGWTSLDVNLAWRMPWNASVSVGARNVLNNPAPPTSNLSDAEMDNLFGRVPYVRYQQDL